MPPSSVDSCTLFFTFSTEFRSCTLTRNVVNVYIVYNTRARIPSACSRRPRLDIHLRRDRLSASLSTTADRQTRLTVDHPRRSSDWRRRLCPTERNPTSPMRQTTVLPDNSARQQLRSTPANHPLSGTAPYSERPTANFLSPHAVAISTI